MRTQAVKNDISKCLNYVFFQPQNLKKNAVSNLCSEGSIADLMIQRSAKQLLWKGEQ